MKLQQQFFPKLMAAIVLTCLALGAMTGSGQNTNQARWQADQDFYQQIWKGDITNVYRRIKENPQIVNQPLWTHETPLLDAMMG
jgi:hypothetical protein